MRDREGGLTLVTAVEVRLMGDLGGWPLWTEEDGPGAAQDWPQLTPGLVQSLQDWNSRWTNTSTRLSVRKDRAVTQALLQEAKQLAARLQSELGDAYQVKLQP